MGYKEHRPLDNWASPACICILAHWAGPSYSVWDLYLYHATCFQFIIWTSQEIVYDRFELLQVRRGGRKKNLTHKTKKLTKFRMSGTLASFMASVAFFMSAWIYFNSGLEIAEIMENNYKVYNLRQINLATLVDEHNIFTLDRINGS